METYLALELRAEQERALRLERARHAALMHEARRGRSTGRAWGAGSALSSASSARTGHGPRGLLASAVSALSELGALLGRARRGQSWYGPPRYAR